MHSFNIFLTINLLLFIVIFIFHENFLLYSLICLITLIHIQLSKNNILIDYLHQPNLILFIQYLLRILTTYNFLLVYLLF
jgi:hypothetical protein